MINNVSTLKKKTLAARERLGKLSGRGSQKSSGGLGFHAADQWSEVHRACGSLHRRPAVPDKGYHVQWCWLQ